MLLSFGSYFLKFLVQGGYDQAHVRDYIRLFPDSALASLFKGYFLYKREPLSEEEDSDENLNAANDEDPMEIILVYATVILSLLSTDNCA
jgi:superkiller protein 3